MKTYDRDTFERAKESWRDFGPEWNALRQIAYDRGFPVAPRGTRHDDRDAEHPTPRAIIWAALVNRPVETLGIARRSGSWGQVVDLIIGAEERHRERAAEVIRDDAWARKDEPDGREATVSLKRIVDRIASS